MARKKKRASSHVIDEVTDGLHARSKRGRSARARGAEFEREVAKMLSVVYPNARRLFGQARDGADSPDVGGTPFWIECGVNGSVFGKYAQGIDDAAATPQREYKRAPVLTAVRRQRVTLFAVEPSVLIALLAFFEKPSSEMRAAASELVGRSSVCSKCGSDVCAGCPL